MKHIISITLLFFFIGQVAFSQQQYLPLGANYKRQVNFEINKNSYAIHTGFKPLLKSEIYKISNVDTVLYDLNRRETFFKKHKENWFFRALLFDNFVSVEKNNFNLYVNPLLYAEMGKHSNGEKYYINTRAIEIKGDIGKKLSFYSSFRENQAKFQPYIYNWAWNRLVVPGQGALKKNNKNLSTFDFSSATAYLSYTPYNWLNLQIGQDKNFIGEGHRSLLLSDNSANYPFAKFSFTYKSLKYVTMFTEFRDFSGAYYWYHTKKHAAFNYLSYNYKNKFEIGFFEGAIYKTTDTSLGYYNKFQIDYFMPIIGTRTAVNGFSSKNKIIAGINAKAKITNFIQAYGQFATSNPSQNEMAYQLGFKVFDLLHGKLNSHNLYFQTEYNSSNDGTYSHNEYVYQTWSHYNQELAHPAGSSFSELLVNMRYDFKNIFLEYNLSLLQLNKNNSYSDIYLSAYKTVYLSPLLPLQKTISHNTILAGYIINKRTNLQIYAGIDLRNELVGKTSSKTKYIMFGLRTGLSNFYYDF